MTPRAALPVGVVGVGSLGFHHARLLREVDGARMVGVYDADPERARAVGAQLGVQVWSSLDAMLSVAAALVVAVPTTDHAAVAMAALGRGIHVLIEKPIAATTEEADAILTQARTNGLLVATGHVERFNSALRAGEPYLQEPQFIESHRLAPFQPRGTDVAVVLDLMIHDIDLVLGLVRRPVLRVDAVGVPVLTRSVDIANARLTFEGGAVANITASRVSRERVRKIRLFQRSGYMSLDFGTGTGEFLRIRTPDMSTGPVQYAADLESLVERVELRGDEKEPLRAELESFVAAVRGEKALVVTGEDGRRALAVALDIVKCIEESGLELSAKHPGRVVR